MPKYKLAYFDIRGLAERCRYVAAIGKLEYEDFRYPISGSPGNWKRPEFEEDQKAGKLDASMGKVPYLEVDGVVIAQSQAINMYLARECGLMGGNAIEAAQVDAMVECCRDVQGAKDEDKPGQWGKLEKAMPGSGGFAVGGKLSLADIVIWHMLASPENAANGKDTVEANAKIKAICGSVNGNAELQAYLSKRKDTPV